MISEQFEFDSLPKKYEIDFNARMLVYSKAEKSKINVN